MSFSDKTNEDLNSQGVIAANDWAEAPLHSVVRQEIESEVKESIRASENEDNSGPSASSSSEDEGLGFVTDGSMYSDDDDSEYEGSDSDDEAGDTLIIDFAKY